MCFVKQLGFKERRGVKDYSCGSLARLLERKFRPIDTDTWVVDLLWKAIFI